jgi:hypothetical protein
MHRVQSGIVGLLRTRVLFQSRGVLSHYVPQGGFETLRRQTGIYSEICDTCPNIIRPFSSLISPARVSYIRYRKAIFLKIDTFNTILVDRSHCIFDLVDRV